MLLADYVLVAPTTSAHRARATFFAWDEIMEAARTFEEEVEEAAITCLMEAARTFEEDVEEAAWQDKAARAGK